MNIKQIILLLSLSSLTACDIMANRLANVGRPPEFNKVNTYNDYIQQEQYLKAKAAQSEQQSSIEPTAQGKAANSLWKPGSRAFFRDLRARAIGDILKVNITIQDKAKLDNKTTKTRSGSTSAGMPSLFGFENKVKNILPDAVNPSKLLNVTSNDNNTGEGKVDRQETINTTVAATVIKILPNNNLYIKGSQEVRVNFEVREVTIEGIVRPEDISTENAVTLDQIAEARVSYGGRGQLSEYQQERLGRQILDIVAPF
ncbi:flagellar L-ring protein FlgH [endosymbiont of Acanthamoeba sp. UWC8]|uniref:flagellar basal body L-ring protein FlgH n=1 Tax=endosymbiont of Acanthamoeba sp. UWC8 TaxID=86106 RepID=UPI0004D139CE|nr:flagellar basal body L-ring protein FlgH [endosymbiont of Acanthamoeba sp. UWC8]AIF81534.1 flagellar L-ring protein FlgH [endosymbiont of Acanthamoeba sp. UWC8]